MLGTFHGCGEEYEVLEPIKRGKTRNHFRLRLKLFLHIFNKILHTSFVFTDHRIFSKFKSLWESSEFFLILRTFLKFFQVPISEALLHITYIFPHIFHIHISSYYFLHISRYYFLIFLACFMSLLPIIFCEAPL